jgi:hypothetical protein
MRRVFALLVALVIAAPVTGAAASAGPASGFGDDGAGGGPAATTPIVLTMTSSANPSVAGDPITLTFTFSRQFDGEIVINQNFPGSQPPPFLSKDDTISPEGTPLKSPLSYELNLLDFSNKPIVGIWHLWADVRGYVDGEDSNLVELDQVVVPVPTIQPVSLAASPTPAVAGAPVQLTATLSRTVSGPPPTSGSVSFAEAGTVLGVAPVATGKATVQVASLAAGDHSIVATYLDAGGLPVSSSTPLVVRVVADTWVAARSVGVSPSTFYPIKDGYRDSLLIRGTLDERASVSVSIYSPAGKKVRAFSVTTRSGPYSVAWNGRTSGGVLLAAGKYKVIQMLRDTAGNKKVVTSYATLSRKRLYWYSSSQTRYGKQFNTVGYCCGASISTGLSRFSRGVLIRGYDDYSWPFASYNFTLPKATAYKSIRFQAQGIGSSGLVALWNWTLADKGGDGACPKSYSWCSTKAVSGSAWVKSRIVSADVIVRYGGWYDVNRVKLTYSYGILK